MILSNTEIKSALEEKRIIIDPFPLEPFDTTAVDLCLGKYVSIPKDGLSLTIVPGIGNLSKSLNCIYEDVIIDKSYNLEPGLFVLAQTRESISLPIIPNSDGNVIAARIEGKSSLARCGLLVHFTAPTIHAGFTGKITLEMINLGKNPIQLTPGMRICQLIFEMVLNTPTPNPSQFQGQEHPAGNF